MKLFFQNALKPEGEAILHPNPRIDRLIRTEGRVTDQNGQKKHLASASERGVMLDLMTCSGSEGVWS
jgi:hypothetical protein